MTRLMTFATGKFLMFSMLCAVLSSCAAVNTYIVSRPTGNSPQVDISKKGRLVIEDAVIFVSPTNYVLINSGVLWFEVISATEDIPAKDQGFRPGYYEGSDKKPGFFIVELFFAVGKNPMLFYPADVVLRYRGQEWRPVNTYELDKMDDATNSFWGHEPYRILCAGKERDKLERRQYHNPIVVTHYDGTSNKLPGIGVPKSLKLDKDSRHCLALEFSVNPPDPREEFDLDLGSLQANNRSIPIRIRYAPNTVTERHL